jgi:CrcB protein
VALLLIGIGGFFGAVARYLVDVSVVAAFGARFPWGTLVVNVSGSFALGILFALAIEREVLSPEIRGPVLVGFIGAYTTFSTLMLETWRLVEAGSYGLALGNLVGSAIIGMAALVGGLILGRAM